MSQPSVTRSPRLTSVPATRSQDPSIRPDLSSRLLPALVASNVAATFHVLGDPTRVRLLAALAAGELPVGDLARLLGMTESAVSHQLRVLKGARMVKARPSGRHVFYALDDLHVLTLFRQALTHVREDLDDPKVST